MPIELLQKNLNPSPDLGLYMELFHVYSMPYLDEASFIIVWNATIIFC